jgi:hypothetical protein
MESQALIQQLVALKQIIGKRKTNSDTTSLTIQALLIASFLLLSWTIVMCTFKMLTSSSIKPSNYESYIEELMLKRLKGNNDTHQSSPMILHPNQYNNRSMSFTPNWNYNNPYIINYGN